MTIKTLLGIAPGNNGNRNNNRSSGSSGSTGNWTFGWTPSQASALSGNAKSKDVKRDSGQSDRQVGVYGVLATRSVSGR